MEYEELLKLIKPKKKGQSDKYSWQLYEFIRRNKYKNVYYYKKNWDGEPTELDPDNISTYQIMVGNMYDCLSGGRLRTIMSDSKDKYTTFSFHPFGGWSNDEFVNITDWFWDKYIKLGRCLFDKQHVGWWTNDSERYTYINKNSRKCNWCGKWQHREIIKKQKIKREEVWENCI